MLAKKNLRKQMSDLRAKINPSSKKNYDLKICSELEQLIQKRNSRTIHSYLPMGEEININPLLQNLLDLGIEVICPKTLRDRKLENRVLHSLDDLEEGLWGTKHPANPIVFEGQLDLILIPGLAFDRSNNRLGYGGGYYDHFLKANPSAYKIGLCYPFQLVGQVPVENHDFVLDEILVLEF